MTEQHSQYSALWFVHLRTEQRAAKFDSAQWTGRRLRGSQPAWGMLEGVMCELKRHHQ